MSTEGKALVGEFAKRFGLAGSANLAQWGLLIVLLAILLSGGGAWWIRSRIAHGEVASSKLTTAQQDNLALTNANKEAHDTLLKQQQLVAQASRNLELAGQRLNKINEDTAHAREENSRQMAIIRQQLDAALAARPDLRNVHVGAGVLHVWNEANRGRASDAGAAAGTAGAAQPHAEGGRKPDGALPAAAARSKER